MLWGFVLGAMMGMSKAKERKERENHERAMEEKIDDLIKIQSGLMTPEQYIAKTTRKNDPNLEKKNMILKRMKPDVWHRADEWKIMGGEWYITTKILLDEMANEGKVIKQNGKYKKI